MNRIMFRSKIGFTLAEVLITVGIIGIIAALVMPALIMKIERKEFAVGLKKAYTNFNQALLQITNDAGCQADLRCTGFVATGSNQDALGNEVIKYMKVLRNCGSTSQGVCMSTKVSAYYNGLGTRSTLNTGGYRFIASDGSSYRLYNYGNNCVMNYSTHKTNSMTQMCGALAIDVNGPDRGPNNEGRDIFRFYITNGKGAALYPMGGVDDGGNGWWKDPATGDPRYCDPRWGYTNGLYCGARVIEEGWEMTY